MSLNSNYGQLMGQLPLIGSGKHFFVGDSSVENVDFVRELFGYDSAGTLRFHETIDSAVSACKGNGNDIVFVLPGHSESIANATSLLLDVAGVKIIGLGEGLNRPTLTFTTATTATVPVSANNCGIENFILTASFADIVAAFTLTTAKNFTLKNCEINASAADVNFLSVIDTNTTDNAADGLAVIDCSWVEPDTATLSFLDVDADLDKLVFSGNYLNLGVNTNDLPAIAIVATGKDLTNARVEGNDVIRLNDANPLLITADTTTANTGIIANNRVRHLDTAGELLVTAGTNFGFFENFASAAVDASGYILPARDS